MIRTDNEIMAIVFDVIRTGLAAYYPVPPLVQQAYQVTQQGVPQSDAVLVHSITSARYGFPQDESWYDETEQEMKQEQSWWLERTYQVDAVIGQADTSATARTAFDYVDAVSSILQTSSALEAFRSNEIGVLRIQPLRVTYIVDDMGRHEQVPSFDFTLTYKQSTLTIVPSLERYDAAIYGV